MYVHIKSLMECYKLMIVVAIIGILAAVAIPAYQDYITRSKVTELVTAASSCKASVSDYFQSQNALPDDTEAAGCSNNATQYVASLAVVDGEITVTASTDLAAAFETAANNTYVLTPDESAGASAPLAWSCTGSTIDKKYLPANCR